MQPSTDTSALRHELIADHIALDRLFDRLLRDMSGGDAATCQTSWAEFETALLDHLEAEEVFLLPAFDRIDKNEANGIRQDHATIRHLLAEMGVRLELHAVKKEHVERLIDSLRRHASREEAALYRWADELAPDLARSLMNRLSADRKLNARAFS
jgi:hemerythrin superfamily protein